MFLTMGKKMQKKILQRSSKFEYYSRYRCVVSLSILRSCAVFRRARRASQSKKSGSGVHLSEAILICA